VTHPASLIRTRMLMLGLAVAWPQIGAAQQGEPPLEQLMVTAAPTTDSGTEASPPAQESVPTSDQSVRLDQAGPYRFSTFTNHVGKAGLEVGAIAAIITVPRIIRRANGSDGFHFKSEGWFGKTNYSLGMDKMHHAFKTYVIADVMQSVIARRTGDKKGAAITGGLLGLGFMTYAEVFDGFSETTGFSYEDGLIHFAGAGLSVLRNVVPGLRDKIDYRMEAAPSFKKADNYLGDPLYDRRYLIATQLAGFKGLERSPLRFVELQAGYYARGFSPQDRAMGAPIKRQLYVGLGFNVQQLFARKPKSKIERWVKGAFDYVQLPYTVIH